jgi:hypothetical protein
MEFDPKDEQVVQLLTKLKNVNGDYPPEMLESRRQVYLKNMAGLGLGTGFRGALKNTVKNGNSAGFAAPSMGTLLEAALVVAIVAETSTLAYFYRDKVAHFFQSFSTTSNVQEIASPPIVNSPWVELGMSGTPTAVFPTGTVLGIPTGTPVPGLTGDLLGNNSNPTLTGSTPVPNGNNGNHYGQTPKPDRTKVNNGNGNNNDKPPKDKPGKGNNK